MAAGIQFCFRQQRYQFRFKTGFFGLSLFFFILFCTLGGWQIQRYHFKQSLLSLYQVRLTAPAKPLIPFLKSLNIPQFQRVNVQGQFANTQTLLLQNQMHEGHQGFEVLTPLQIPGETKLLLVDRGWLAKEKLTVLPKETTRLTSVTGYLKLLNEHNFILGKNIYDPKGVPLIIQRIDIEEIGRMTQQTFFPFILRLDSKAKDGLIRDWIITNTLPEKHLGYAIQWFVMALTLFIAFICFCCEKIYHDDSTQ